MVLDGVTKWPQNEPLQEAALAGALDSLGEAGHMEITERAAKLFPANPRLQEAKRRSAESEVQAGIKRLRLDE